jgi:hypothetical protein
MKFVVQSPDLMSGVNAFTNFRGQMKAVLESWSIRGCRVLEETIQSNETHFQGAVVLLKDTL